LVDERGERGNDGERTSMQPTSDGPGEVRPNSLTQPPIDPQHDTRGFPPIQVTPNAVVAAPGLAAPAELAGMLLPSERVTFGSTPHAIVFARPLFGIAATLVALAVVLLWETHPVVHGRHVTVPLVDGLARTAVLVVGALAILRGLYGVVRAALYFFGYRVATTNRRVFVVEGLFGRRVRPLGNTSMAGATMSQGMLGRSLGYGDVVLPGVGRIREMRDPIRLYREFEAVANGVDGDTWTPAIRQTQIP
jgi:hypothetical protein